MNRIDLLRRDLEGLQAYLDEFEECVNGEPREASLGDAAEVVAVRNFPLPDRFHPDHVDLLLVVPDYPGAPPTGLYILNDSNAALLARLRDEFTLLRDRAYYTAPAIPGFTWICYHYAHHAWRFDARRPERGDNLRKFLMSFYNACEHRGRTDR